jgi:hypothetical protein
MLKTQSNNVKDILTWAAINNLAKLNMFHIVQQTRELMNNGCTPPSLEAPDATYWRDRHIPSWDCKDMPKTHLRVCIKVCLNDSSRPTKPSKCSLFIAICLLLLDLLLLLLAYY